MSNKFELKEVKKGLFVVENAYSTPNNYFSRGVPSRVKPETKVENNIYLQIKDLFGSYMYDYNQKGNMITFSVDSRSLVWGEIRFFADVFVTCEIERYDDSFWIKGTLED